MYGAVQGKKQIQWQMLDVVTAQVSVKLKTRLIQFCGYVSIGSYG